MIWKNDYNLVRPHSPIGSLAPSIYADLSPPECNGSGRYATPGAPPPDPLNHRANWAQMLPRLYPSLDESWGLIIRSSPASSASASALSAQRPRMRRASE